MRKGKLKLVTKQRVPKKYTKGAELVSCCDGCDKMFTTQYRRDSGSAFCAVAIDGLHVIKRRDVWKFYCNSKCEKEA